MRIVQGQRRDACAALLVAADAVFARLLRHEGGETTRGHCRDNSQAVPRATRETRPRHLWAYNTSTTSHARDASETLPHSCCAAPQVKNLYNALKYSTAFPLVYTGYLRKLEPSAWNDHAFVAAAILQSSYCFVWDVLMDWGLPKCADGLGEK